MNMKYQIFVSSTYEDLKAERDQVVKAILEMGHIPVGMEMFSAGDEQQWKLIARQIESSDYYVVIAAHRYGSLDGAISYTEKEYDYAATCGVPTLGFILKDGAPWPANYVDKDTKKVKALNSFKDKIKHKLISFWTTGDDLHGKVSIALMKQMVASPREGWVRASGAASPQILAELARLSQENGELRTRLAATGEQEKRDERDLRDRTIAALQSNVISVSIWYTEDTNWTSGLSKTLYDLFYLLAPQLMVDKSVDATCNYLAKMWKDPKRKAREKWPVPTNNVKSWLADLGALDLIKPSDRKRPSTDTNEYWTLTEIGRALYRQLRRSLLEAGLPTDDATGAKGDGDGDGTATA